MRPERCWYKRRWERGGREAGLPLQQQPDIKLALLYCKTTSQGRSKQKIGKTCRHLYHEEALLSQQDATSFLSCQWENSFPEFTCVFICLFTFVGMGKRTSLHLRADPSIFTRTVQTLTIGVAIQDQARYISQTLLTRIEEKQQFQDRNRHHPRGLKFEWRLV